MAPLKVAVIGPKGQCGSCVVDELLSRGHTVVGLSRSPPETWPKGRGKYSSLVVDVDDVKSTTKAFSLDFDAIVCAYGPPLSNLSLVYAHAVESHAKIKAALLASSHEGSFIIIGGAGSLHMKHGGDFVDEPEFVYQHWYEWSDEHLDYMATRAYDHKSKGFSRYIRTFKWARNNVEKPGWFSWMFRPLAWLVLNRARTLLTGASIKGLIMGSRIALRFWEGVRDKQWSFVSPPWLLRDKGIRTGEYKVLVDTADNPAYQAIEAGIYNEDMAAAIVDEVENKELAFQHWTCIGPIGLKEW